MSIRRPILIPLFLAIIGAIAIFGVAAPAAHASPAVTTDKPDYAPNETVVITGTGFNTGDVLDVVVIRPNGSIVKGDGSLAPGWDTVTAAPGGGFTYNYQLDGIVGPYTIQVYAHPWNGPESFDVPMAVTYFTDFTTLGVTINAGAHNTDSLSVTLLVSWGGAGNDATQARFANDLSPENDCADLGGGVFGPWQTITEIGTSNTATFPHTLASQTITGLRRVCSEVAEGSLATPVNPLAANDTIFYRVPNPALAQTCGVDMVIVMDSSGSMDAAELAAMKAALVFFTGAFLPETPTQIAIVEFDTTATITQPFTSNETVLNTAINGATSGGTTNWDDALAKADSLFPNRPANPDLVVMASDGNPNTRGNHTHLGHSAAVTSVSDQDAMSWASAEANDIRTDGARIVTLGIGDALNINNLVTISGPTISPPAPINTKTDVITTGFATLAASLAALADSLCGGTITVHKIIDSDGNLGTTGDQSNGPGFTFNTNVDPPDFSTPASGDTDGGGFINFAINTGANNTAVVDVIEPGEPGYTFISANCTKPDGPDPGPDPDPVGTPGSMVVNNIPISDNDIITCTFYNTAPQTADVKITAQSPTAPPTANAGVNFSIDVNKTMHNNGPATPAPVLIVPKISGPADCIIIANAGNPSGATLPLSVPTPVTERFTVRCSQPSAHQFTVSNCIFIDPVSALTDPNPANNCWPPQVVNVNVVGQSDIMVSAVTMNGPPSASAGIPFVVNANADLRNNGPTGPTNVDVTLSLTLPGDCTTVSTNPLVVQNVMLGVSLLSSVPASWTVTCTNPSAHNFTTNLSAVIDQIHVTDPNPGNNSGASAPRTVNILADADVKVTAANTALPPSVIAGSPFTVNGTGTIHNNGPFGPANVDTTIQLLLPPDCTTGSTNPVIVQNTVLPTSTATPVGASWSVTCTNPSSHDFRTSASTVVDQLHIVDPNGANNAMTSPTATIAVNAISDIKVTSVTVTSPPSFGAYAPFNVTGSATLHNNGPTGPTNVDATLTLTMPADCTTPSTNPVTVPNTSLAVSAATPVPGAPATWSVTCTNPSSHQFQVGASAVVDQLHVTDPNGANGSGTSTTTIVPAFITVCKDVVPDDSTLWDFTATGPTPANINDLGDGLCAQFHPNMIPGSYTITETPQLGYAASVNCGANGSQGDNDITFTLDPGEQVTCQYVNGFHPGPPAVGGIAGLIDDAQGVEAPRSVSADEGSHGVSPLMLGLAGLMAMMAATLVVASLSLARRQR